jgi:hypothetical protein
MSSTRIIGRLGAATGVAYVALTVVGNDILGHNDSPAPGARPAEFARWLTASRPIGAGWIGPFLELLGLLCFVIFAAALCHTLRRAERERSWLPDAALGAGLVSVAIKITAAPAMMAGFQLARHGIEPQLAAAVVQANDYAFLLTFAVDAVMIGAAATVALRTAALPRWLATAGAVIAPLLLASVAAGTDGPPVFLLALLWFAAVSVALVRSGPTFTTAAAMQPVSQT